MKSLQWLFLCLLILSLSACSPVTAPTIQYEPTYIPFGTPQPTQTNTPFMPTNVATQEPMYPQLRKIELGVWYDTAMLKESLEAPITSNQAQLDADYQKRHYGCVVERPPKYYITADTAMGAKEIEPGIQYGGYAVMRDFTNCYWDAVLVIPLDYRAEDGTVKPYDTIIGRISRFDGENDILYLSVDGLELPLNYSEATTSITYQNEPFEVGDMVQVYGVMTQDFAKDKTLFTVAVIYDIEYFTRVIEDYESAAEEVTNQ